MVGLPTPGAAPTRNGPAWSRARIVHGLIFFLIATAIGFAFLAHRGTLDGGLAALGRMQVWAIAVGLLQVVLDQVLGGMRIWCCLRAVGAPAPVRACIASNAANVFLGGLTPSQSGGGPAQILVLVKAGVPLALATLAAWLGFVGTALWFLILGLVFPYTAASRLLPSGWNLYTHVTVAIFTGFLLALLLVLPHPAGLARVPWFGPRWARSRRRLQLEAFLAASRAGVHRARRHGKRAFAASLALSVALYVNKFLVAVTVLRGLGIEAPVQQVLELQMLQFLVLYFAPTPGASGLAEITAGTILQRVVPADHLAAYLILWRTFTLYLGMALGALILIRTAAAGSVRGPAVESHARIAVGHARR
jgi:uncharacterized protein (TIRG00374 family)